MNQMPSLLAPAGNMRALQTALRFGADAVYIGGKAFSLRAFADNFSNEEIIEAANYAHALGKKVYVTANIFARNDDLDALKNYFVFLQSAGRFSQNTAKVPAPYPCHSPVLTV